MASIKFTSWSTLAMVAAGLLLVSGGCGGSNFGATGTVSGVVTMDGAPLPDADVFFSPEEGRGSSGVTDASGRYELLLIGDRKGAVVGKHKVYIKNEKIDGNGNVTKKNTVPMRYNKNTELKANVVSGSQEINFELKTR